MIELTNGLVGCPVRVECLDGTSYTGKCIAYTPAMDNTPKIESIWIHTEERMAREVYASEIRAMSYRR